MKHIVCDSCVFLTINITLYDFFLFLPCTFFSLLFRLEIARQLHTQYPWMRESCVTTKQYMHRHCVIQITKYHWFHFADYDGPSTIARLRSFGFVNSRLVIRNSAWYTNQLSSWSMVCSKDKAARAQQEYSFAKLAGSQYDASYNDAQTFATMTFKITYN